MSDTVLEGRNPRPRLPCRRRPLRASARTVHAVKGVSFTVEKGKTLAIVGESGCGKSTLARIITLIDPPTSGELLIDGKPIDIARHGVTPEMRRKVQIVFQNPYGSLNPRQKIGDVLAEPLLHQHRHAGRRAARPRHGDADARSASGPSTSTAIRTCSPAASASASPSPAR